MPGAIAAALSRIVDLGVNAATPPERASTIRALNVILLVLALLAVCGGTVGAIRASPLYFGAGNVIFVLAFALAFLVNAAGQHSAARFIAAGVTAAQYAFLCLGLGLQSGSEFTAIGLAFAPLMIFTPAERKSLILVYALYAATWVGVEIFLAIHPPLLQLPPADLALSRIIAVVQLSGFCALVVWYYRSAASLAQQKLQRANERLSELLLNMLPAIIAARLQTGESLIADSHAEATVLFADLVGFSSLNRQFSPAHVVELLNALFSAFDEAAARHGVEKIKTIGDGYMAAAGVLSTAGQPAEAMADFALDMLGIAGTIGDHSGAALQLRIGMSTGPVISGVIGRQKYAFDVWGDTVNLASRMASDSEPGRIQVAEATYRRLHRRYRFEERGMIDVKGYPNTRAYLLTERLARSEAMSPAGARSA